MTITVELTWNTSFETKEEYDDFIQEIADIHARRYGTNVVKEVLPANDYYEGARNFILVKHSDFPDTNDTAKFKVGDHVKILPQLNKKNDDEGKIDMVDYTNDQYFVTNMNMPFMGTTAKWFSGRDLGKL